MKTKILIKPLIAIAAAWFATDGVTAKVVMPRVFSPGMVLQQQTEVKLWGTANAKATVKVVTSWNGKTYQTRAGEDGSFALKVSTPAAGLTPYYILVDDGNGKKDSDNGKKDSDNGKKDSDNGKKDSDNGKKDSGKGKKNNEDRAKNDSDNGKNDSGSTVIDNVLIGEVWLCSGQSNMNMSMNGRYGDPVLGALDAVATSRNAAIRMFNVGAKMDNTPHDDCRGEWKEASPETVPAFSAAAYFFARKINEVEGVPVGILHASYGGSRVEAWMSNEAAAPYKSMPEVQNSSILYNGMMAPLAGYGIRGCLWYQGEANVDQPDLYTRLLPAMVSDWRERWGVGEFPFIYAQIAPFNYNKGEGKGKNSAYLREAQTKCLPLINNSGMIILSDVGDARTIHPMDKQTVGHRFAYMAMERVYGYKDFPATPPMYRSMTVEGNKATLTFDNAESGLTSYRRPLTDFEVAGADSVFHKAHASFGQGMKTIVVSAKEVEHPVAVRYAFKDCFDCCLFNIWGLPVSSFRTDDW